MAPNRLELLLAPLEPPKRPPELLELYGLYQQELASRNEKEANYLTELNVMLRVWVLLDIDQKTDEN